MMSDRRGARAPNGCDTLLGGDGKAQLIDASGFAFVRGELRVRPTLRPHPPTDPLEIPRAAPIMGAATGQRGHIGW